MKNLKFLSLITFIFLFSCDSLVNEISPDKIPSTKPTLVINGYISPQDTILAVKIQLTKPILGETSINVFGGFGGFGGVPIVKDAKVFLSQGNKNIELKYDDKNLLYVANPKSFKIESGLTYSLKVTDSQGKTYSAETTVPLKPDFDILTITKSKGNNFGNPPLNIPVKWEADKDTYYRLGAVIISQSEFTAPDGKVIKQIRDNGTYLKLIDNKTSNKKSITEILTGFLPYVGNNSNNKSVVLKSYIKFFQVDKNYYLYHESIFRNNNDSNPFAEPSLVFSNIQNGFGCFGSYSATEKEFNVL
jgi:Domain of unknown function (DUF4249)